MMDVENKGATNQQDAMEAAAKREFLIDAIARDLLLCGNPPDWVEERAGGAKALKPGTPVHIPGKPFCVGIVANGVGETLQVHVTDSLSCMDGAIFAAPADMLAARPHEQ